MIGFTRRPTVRLAAIAAIGIGAIALSGCTADGTSSASGDPHTKPTVEVGAR